VAVRHKAVLITINKLYRSDMSADELHETTRGVWKVGVKRERAEYAIAVYQGIPERSTASAPGTPQAHGRTDFAASRKSPAPADGSSRARSHTTFETCTSATSSGKAGRIRSGTPISEPAPATRSPGWASASWISRRQCSPSSARIAPAGSRRTWTEEIQVPDA
jgi:hypothetical protein